MNIKSIFVAAALTLCAGAAPAYAQFNIGKAINAAAKGAKALTLTDAQMAEYVRESVKQMDTLNKVSDENSEYTKRLRRLTKGLTQVEGIPLNFKVYEVIDINAFACPDGSVRVFSSLMDIMSDDELLGVIGHEIGHVAKHHSKNAFKHELLTGALKDAISSTGGVVGALTDSQLGTLGQALSSAKYSQKQETEADDYGYNFLKQHGINPWGMAMAFEKLMGSDSNQQTSYIQKMFSSHPDTQKRIKRVVEKATKDGFTRPASK